MTPATLSPTTATFDKYTSSSNYKDVTTTLTGGELEDVKVGGTSLGSSNYSFSSGTLTIKKEYLSTLATGSVEVTVVTDDGNATLTITVADTTPASISPTTAEFDKNSSSAGYVDVTTTVSHGTVTGVSNGEDALTESTDYTFSEGTLTIKKEYLDDLSTGEVALTVTTDNGTATLTITVSQSE